MCAACWKFKSNAVTTLKLLADSDYLTSFFISEMYGDADGTVPATFQLIYFIGWKPDKSQKGQAKRGSGTVPLGELGNVISRLE